ncbi:MAG TPA: hypothetical protein VGQ81_11225 [Acidobacteriota bacterium]|nr:hypothetical protein [Acidobacteriota bacterium]
MLVLVLIGVFLLFIPLAAADSLVWTFGKVAKVKSRIETQRFAARHGGSKESLLG